MRPSQSQSALRAQSDFVAERCAQSARCARTELNQHMYDAFLRARSARSARSALPRSGSAPEAL